MNNPLNTLSARDKRLLMLAAPIVLLLVVLIGARALFASQGAAQEHLDRSLEDIAWLQAQADAIPAAGRQCPVASWQPKRVAMLAGRYGVDLAATPIIDRGELRLAIAGADGNGVLELLAVLACQGARTSQLELTSDATSGAVSGELAMALPTG